LIKVQEFLVNNCGIGFFISEFIYFFLHLLVVHLLLLINFLVSHVNVDEEHGHEATVDTSLEFLSCSSLLGSHDETNSKDSEKITKEEY